MPVVENSPHEITKRTEASPYGCKDKQFLRQYPLHVRDYTDDESEYKMVHSTIPHRMSTECRYDKSLTDPRCAVCRHKGKGEEYNQLIRELGK